MRLIIISGLSGSGKSIALQMLEDLGYYCIDNIPARLLQSFVSDTIETQDPAYSLTAVGLDARNRPRDLATIPTVVEDARDSGVHCEVIFLHADDGVLLKRYRESRRRHPLSKEGVGLRDAIAEERDLLAPVRDAADLVLDTSRSSVHELREILRARVARSEIHHMSLMFESFGFKHGTPANADFVFDSRCLPNPHWDTSLRELTGKDQPVISFLESHSVVQRMYQDLVAFLERWVSEFRRTNRAYLTVAVGCTGGRHRSVYLVEKLARHFAEVSEKDIHVLIRHNGLTSEATELVEA